MNNFLLLLIVLLGAYFLMNCNKVESFTDIISGSYDKSCRNIVKNYPILSAECRRNNGTYNSSSINVKQCPIRKYMKVRTRLIKNDSGNLRCI